MLNNSAHRPAQRPVLPRPALPLRFAAAGLIFLCAAPSFALRVEYLPAVSAASQAGAARSQREVAGGRALVKFSAELSSSSKRDLLNASGFEPAGEFEFMGWSAVKLPVGMSVASALPALKGIAGVLAAEPSGVYHAAKVPLDQYRVEQYGLVKTDAFRAWDFETGFSTRVTVAVLDTGIDGSHPDLGPKLSGTGQFFDPDNFGARTPDDPPTPACSHATKVAGIAAAATDNSYGIAGMSWGAGLLSLKVFSAVDCFADCSDRSGGSSCSTDDLTIIKAINYAVLQQNSPAAGRIVINMSLGQAGGCSGLMQAAVSSAAAAGLVLVAAAGNNPAGVDSPANCLGVLPVGATDVNDNLASFSARGAEMSARGVTAPGVNTFTTVPGPGFAADSGTSFASPLAAGLAALLISTRPALTPTQVGDVIRNSADDLGAAGPDALYGFGRLNAYKAMLLLVTGNTSAFAPAAPRTGAYAFPSPYRPGAGLLSFFIPDEISGANLEISVYTSEGEKIKKISGQTWDGRNEAGRAAASGVYLFFIKTEKGTAKGKFALIR
ncbi:MAG: S8 family serine peptidase [Elusimicrobiales bacterium]|jgi:subtilisin family serine protease